jgi:hypothetical protein
MPKALFGTEILTITWPTITKLGKYELLGHFHTAPIVSDLKQTILSLLSYEVLLQGLDIAHV